MYKCIDIIISLQEMVGCLSTQLQFSDDSSPDLDPVFCHLNVVYPMAKYVG